TQITLDGKDITLIDDSYNASPASMRAAFSKLSEAWEAGGKTGRKVLALGNMLELGDDSAKLHAGLASDIAGAGADVVFTAGALMQHLHDALPAEKRGGHGPEAAALAPMLAGALRSGDLLLIKGSHGSKIYQLAAALTQQGEKNAV
ncbi:MAG: UDP-N-acetylmuramoylalanyl-D-glutamyl-2, 6-diaminopimelate--D-alanyl-D-alanine ligase, partial [Alphaproteobacteria bacterium]|nr:UDP-N-acetylmuramoylalanyl-D-glutamyl-2, 6-diaminopimelate--D-alanyl-D-alanine ligase [Alphaproteobacteria bacterium]